MKIAYVSDIHLDFITKDFNYNKMTRFVKNFFKGDDSDVLILAGDLSHYNSQSEMFISLAIELKKYKKVFVVAGNHEFYNVSKNQKLKYTKLYDRVNELKELVNAIPEGEFLDGNVMDISYDMNINDDIQINEYEKIKHLEKEFILEKLKGKKFKTTQEMVEFILN